MQSLTKVLPDWRNWAKRAANLDVLKDAVYPFPHVVPKFLGTIVQNYRPRDGSPARAFQTWIDRINKNVAEELFPALEKSGLTLPRTVYEAHGVNDFCLATIPDFNSLIAKSQEHQTPVYALTPEQIGQAGTVLATTLESRDNFNAMFSALADKVNCPSEPCR